MRLLTTLFFFLSQIVICHAQKDTIISDLNWPIGLEIKNEILYFVEATADRISKFDLGDISPVPEVIWTDLDNPAFIEIKGDDLYVVERGEGGSLGKISKINLLDTNPVSEIILDGLNSPKDILIMDSELYYAEIGTISKINLNEINPTPTLLVSGLVTFVNLASDGEFLYYSEYPGNRISSLNLITNELDTILSDLDGPLGGMLLNDGLLYFSEYDSKSVSIYDLKDPGSEIINFDTNLSGADIKLSNGHIYISEFENDIILKYGNVVSNLENVAITAIEIVPNPASDFIRIKGELLTTSYFIITINGSIMAQNKTLVDNQIDISYLPAGSYFLFLENGGVTKFIKM